MTPPLGTQAADVNRALDDARLDHLDADDGMTAVVFDLGALDAEDYATFERLLGRSGYTADRYDTGRFATVTVAPVSLGRAGIRHTLGNIATAVTAALAATDTNPRDVDCAQELAAAADIITGEVELLRAALGAGTVPTPRAGATDTERS